VLLQKMANREQILLDKAEALLDTLDEFDNKVNPTFQEFFDSVLNKWNELNLSKKEVSRLNGLENHELTNSVQPLLRRAQTNIG
jgi:hypothetical protein